MKKHIKYLLISLPILLILSVISFEMILRNIPNDYRYKAKYLKENGGKIETLILGSSHSFYGVNPDLLPNSFSLAHTSQTIDLDYKILDKNINYLPNLKNIIIPISYFTYLSRLQNGKEKEKIKFYNIYYGINTEVKDLNMNYELFNNSLNKNIQRIKTYFKNPKAEIKIKESGSINKRNLFNKEDYYSDKAVKRHTIIHDDELFKENLNYLNNIISIANNNNIDVILISTPVSEEYFKSIDKQQFKRWKSTTSKIVDHNSNVTWLNLLENRNSFIVNDFVDADHLSQSGADKVTLKIDSIIKYSPFF